MAGSESARESGAGDPEPAKTSTENERADCARKITGRLSDLKAANTPPSGRNRPRRGRASAKWGIL